jgi:predicted KAP-like P-loop ATPase
MALLRKRIDDVKGSKDDTYWRDVRQISFNAWHYSDSNLWASLGDEIFRQLLREPDRDVERQQRFRDELEKSLEQRAELKTAAEHARDVAERLRTEMAIASAERDSRAADFLKALEESPETQR